ncbi:MAG TPA: LLM class flavin-dependent oxidoreductase [Solirubrobacteraceae bacterium]|nr:LLM class flavin-dependent oxidoreductase [Solirubrobacteraceae bacterium]
MKIRFAVAPHAGSLSGAELAGFAESIEAAGFDGLWLSDLPVAPVLDPLLGLALAAGRTTRLHLGANLVPLGRNPFLLAKELAQLDQISGGRLLLSFVTGLGQPDERQALGLNGARRGDVLEEVLGLVRSWWAGETVDHRSDRWTFDHLAPAARPVQDPLEVWLGGRGPQALDRVGRIADGWLGAQLTPAEAGPARRDIHEAAGRAGREVDPEHFGMSIPYARLAPDAELVAPLAGRRPDIDPLAFVPVGRIGLRDFIEGYIDAGLSKFVVRPLAPVASWTEEAAWLGDAILGLQT